MKTSRFILKMAFRMTAIAALLGVSSCLPLAAGAAAGYVAHKEGVRVQSPITRE